LEEIQFNRYRSIGAQLASYLRSWNGLLPESSVLQAVVADLAGSDTELVLPLKALVGKPGFRSLAALAGSGTGEIYRNALLMEMKATFTPQVLDALSELIDGLLDLKLSTSQQNLSIFYQPATRSGKSGKFAGLSQLRKPFVAFGLLFLIFIILAVIGFIVRGPSISCWLTGSCRLNTPLKKHSPLRTLPDARKASPQVTHSLSHPRSEVTLRASEKVVNFPLHGYWWRLTLHKDGKTGELELTDNGWIRVFTLDECRPGGQKHIKDFSDRGGWISNSSWGSILWQLCEKGIESFG
jgi:hypothetical protein